MNNWYMVGLVAGSAFLASIATVWCWFVIVMASTIGVPEMLLVVFFAFMVGFFILGLTKEGARK